MNNRPQKYVGPLWRHASVSECTSSLGPCWLYAPESQYRHSSLERPANLGTPSPCVPCSVSTPRYASNLLLIITELLAKNTAQFKQNEASLCSACCVSCPRATTRIWPPRCYASCSNWLISQAYALAEFLFIAACHSTRESLPSCLWHKQALCVG